MASGASGAAGGVPAPERLEPLRRFVVKGRAGDVIQEPVSLRDRLPVVAPDVSGSTEGPIEEKIERAVRTVFEASPHGGYVAAWDHFSHGCHFVQPGARPMYDKSHGGTSPDRLFREHEFVRALREPRSWLLFITDGEIPQSEVVRLSQHTAATAHLPVVCLLVQPGLDATSAAQANISVFAPLLAACRHLMVLGINTNPDNERYIILHAQGAFATDAPHMGLLDMLDVYVEVAEQELDALPTAVVHGLRLDLRTVLATRQLSEDELEAFGAEGLQQLAIASRTTGKMEDFRSLLKRTQEVHAPSGPVTAPEDLVRTDMMSMILELHRRMREMGAEDPGRAALEQQVLEVRARLADHLKAKAAEEATEAHQRQAKALSLKRMIQGALGFATSLEKDGYRADVLSNRARRAHVVEEDEALVREVKTEGACTGECLVCTDVKPLALLLRRLTPEQAANNTEDFALNYPLAVGGSASNAHLLSPAVLCVDCAQAIRTCPMSRTPLAVLPLQLLDLRHSVNREHMLEAASVALTKGAVLPTNAMLLLAVLEHHRRTYQWAQEGDLGRAVDFFTQQLLTHTISTETLTDEGRKVPLREALSLCVQNPTAFTRQPVASCASILRFLHDYHLAVPEDQGAAMMQTRLLQAIVSAFVADAKAQVEGSSTASVAQRIRGLLFATMRFGAPVRGTERLPDFELVMPGLAQELQELRALLQTNPKSLTTDIFPSPASIAWLLATLLRYEETRSAPLAGFRVESCMERLKSEPAGALTLSTPALSEPGATLGLVRARFHFGDVDAAHAVCPPFAPRCFWPSVRRCVCGYAFDPEDGDAMTFEARLAALKQRRMEHFQQVYHSRNTAPFAAGDDRSLHCNMHLEMTQAWVLAPDEAKARVLAGDAEALETYVQSAVRRIVQEDGRGDVFYPDLERDVRELLPSLMASLRTRAVPWRTKAISVEAKLRWELNGGPAAVEVEELDERPAAPRPTIEIEEL